MILYFLILLNFSLKISLKAKMKIEIGIACVNQRTVTKKNLKISEMPIEQYYKKESSVLNDMNSLIEILSFPDMKFEFYKTFSTESESSGIVIKKDTLRIEGPAYEEISDNQEQEFIQSAQPKEKMFNELPRYVQTQIFHSFLNLTNVLRQNKHLKDVSTYQILEFIYSILFLESENQEKEEVLKLKETKDFTVYKKDSNKMVRKNQKEYIVKEEKKEESEKQKIKKAFEEKEEEKRFEKTKAKLETNLNTFKIAGIKTKQIYQNFNQLRENGINISKEDIRKMACISKNLHDTQTIVEIEYKDKDKRKKGEAKQVYIRQKSPNFKDGISEIPLLRLNILFDWKENIEYGIFFHFSFNKYKSSEIFIEEQNNLSKKAVTFKADCPVCKNNLIKNNNEFGFGIFIIKKFENDLYGKIIFPLYEKNGADNYGYEFIPQFNRFSIGLELGKKVYEISDNVSISIFGGYIRFSNSNLVKHKVFFGIQANIER